MFLAGVIPITTSQYDKPITKYRMVKFHIKNGKVVKVEEDKYDFSISIYYKGSPSELVEMVDKYIEYNGLVGRGTGDIRDDRTRNAIQTYVSRSKKYGIKYDTKFRIGNPPGVIFEK